MKGKQSMQYAAVTPCNANLSGMRVVAATLLLRWCPNTRWASQQIRNVSCCAAGKTLTVHAVARACCAEVAAAFDGAPPPVLLSINCMSLANPTAVFARILAGLDAACSGVAGAKSGSRRASLCGSDGIIRPGACQDVLNIHDVASTAREGVGKSLWWLRMVIDFVVQIEARTHIEVPSCTCRATDHLNSHRGSNHAAGKPAAGTDAAAAVRRRAPAQQPGGRRRQGSCTEAVGGFDSGRAGPAAGRRCRRAVRAVPAAAGAGTCSRMH